jgi:hypothetical protein
MSTTDQRPALVEPKLRVAGSLVNGLEKTELLGCLDCGELIPDEWEPEEGLGEPWILGPAADLVPDGCWAHAQAGKRRTLTATKPNTRMEHLRIILPSSRN